MNTAVQWATLAMASPPGLVSASRQLYCAWYSLGNIDLRLPSPQAHAFAAGAVKAPDEGSHAPAAHPAGPGGGGPPRRGGGGPRGGPRVLPPGRARRARGGGYPARRP